MQINPLPFLFVPGVAGVGCVLGGATGMGAALLTWAGVVMLATAIDFLSRAFNVWDLVDHERLDARPS